MDPVPVSQLMWSSWWVINWVAVWCVTWKPACSGYYKSSKKSQQFDKVTKNIPKRQSSSVGWMIKSLVFALKNVQIALYFVLREHVNYLNWRILVSWLSFVLERIVAQGSELAKHDSWFSCFLTTHFVESRSVCLISLWYGRIQVCALLLTSLRLGHSLCGMDENDSQTAEWVKGRKDQLWASLEVCAIV